jgi:hypothetical protein
VNDPNKLKACLNYASRYSCAKKEMREKGGIKWASTIADSRRLSFSGRAAESQQTHAGEM